MVSLAFYEQIEKIFAQNFIANLPSLKEKISAKTVSAQIKLRIVEVIRNAMSLRNATIDVEIDKSEILAPILVFAL